MRKLKIIFATVAVIAALIPVFAVALGYWHVFHYDGTAVRENLTEFEEIKAYVLADLQSVRSVQPFSYLGRKSNAGPFIVDNIGWTGEASNSQNLAKMNQFITSEKHWVASLRVESKRKDV